MHTHPSGRPAHQRGGTFLGIVIGVVLGLGAALGVAVYVTKVPVPFLNRNQGRNPDQDALEAQKNRDWDPNSGILGKRSAKPPQAAGATGALPGAADGVAAPRIPDTQAPVAGPAGAAPVPAAAAAAPAAPTAAAAARAAAPKPAASGDP
ncbi:MAG: hypothetical protein V4505_25065, partial [Pseudomonadota bacterium]